MEEFMGLFSTVPGKFGQKITHFGVIYGVVFAP
jgi:hypothetical protein